LEQPQFRSPITLKIAVFGSCVSRGTRFEPNQLYIFLRAE
jgi:hypothetical protein